ncbi:MAG TPA: VanW family protein [Abditibacteriaceae bacterium]
MQPLKAVLPVLLTTTCLFSTAEHKPVAAQTARSESSPTGAPATATASVKRSQFGKINVAGVSIENLNQTEATRRLTRELAPKLNALYALTDGRRYEKRKRRDLGAQLDIARMLTRAGRGDAYVPMLLKVDEAQLRRALRRVAPLFAREMKSARVVYYRGKVTIAPEQNKQRLNIGGSAVRIAQTVEKNPGVKALPLALYTRTPQLTAARLKGIDGVLATYSTPFNASNVKRTNNMRIAIKEIDGRLLSPGEVFSLNGTVGERTQARGYRTTIIFQNGYKVPGIGGGVSQVTGTLFNAALEAGLDILTYRTHSQPVKYISLGRDATVAWGGFDMKFKNNTKAPVYISYKVGDRVTATLFGKKQPGRKVAVRVVSKNIGPREIKAQLYRTIRQNGKVVTKERIGSSHYKWNVGAWEE